LQNSSLANVIRVNDFIAYKPYYLDTVPENARRPIFCGQVTHVFKRTGKVQIRAYYTSSKHPLLIKLNHRVEYKKYKTAKHNLHDVEIAAIYHVFKIDQIKWDKWSLDSNNKKLIVSSIAGKEADADVLATCRATLQ
jgi:hypothetical protein